MDFSIQFPLEVSLAQKESLRALQEQFAAACNYLAPLVRDNQCWNRVALHHLAYKALRTEFPQLGSQMACNAIYSVCRSAKVVYQHPQSPWHISKKLSCGLPLLRFLPESPVYFDRHTLSFKEDRLSLFTLDGRMRFKLEVSDEMRQRFQTDRLREISLVSHGKGYLLIFIFGEFDKQDSVDRHTWTELPEYLIVDPELAPPVAA